MHVHDLGYISHATLEELAEFGTSVHVYEESKRLMAFESIGSKPLRKFEVSSLLEAPAHNLMKDMLSNVLLKILNEEY